MELITEIPVQFTRNEQGHEFISGYAVVWYDPSRPGTEYKLPHGVIERVDRHAFDDVLKTQTNIPVVYAHEGSHYLGDTETGTVQLSLDDVGLKVTVPYDSEDPEHANVKAKMRKKIVRGMSFQGDGKAKRFRDPKGQIYSIITKVNHLDDLSFVHKPAYKSTTAQFIRSEIDRIEAQERSVAKAKEILKKANTYKVSQSSRTPKGDR